MHITVAICTWNRARLLDLTLAEFRRLLIPPGVEWELLVVNNNCTDETDAVIERHAGALPIRRLFEPEPGLSRARNRAVAGASGDLIVWTDDDVLVHQGWLAAYAQAAEDWPDAAFFGGAIEPLFEVEPPDWIAANLRRLGDAFALCQLGPGTRALTPGEVVLGANMAFRSSAFARDAFDVRFGALGAEKLAGEEVYFQERLVEMGRLGVWVGPARVRHLIPAQRLTPEFIRHCFRGLGRTKARREWPQRCPLLLGYPRFAVRRYLAARLALAGSRPGGPQRVDAMATSAYYEGFLSEARRLWRAGHHAGRSAYVEGGPVHPAARPARPLAWWLDRARQGDSTWD